MHGRLELPYGTTRGWLNDDMIFFIGWTIPLRLYKYIYFFKYHNYHQCQYISIPYISTFATITHLISLICFSMVYSCNRVNISAKWAVNHSLITLYESMKKKNKTLYSIIPNNWKLNSKSWNCVEKNKNHTLIKWARHSTSMPSTNTSCKIFSLSVKCAKEIN